MADPFVIIGGDAAGLSAASKFKREQPNRDAIVFEKGDWVSYAHCGMPYYVKGEVDSLTDLLSLTPEEIADRGIDLYRRHEVIAVEPEKHTVTVKSEEKTFEQSYEELLIATGAHAVSEPIEGSSLDGVFTMHHMDTAGTLRAYLKPPNKVNPATFEGKYIDRDRVETYADKKPPESAVIVGGGYVGVEMAEALRTHDLDVHLFQRPDQILPPFGSAVGDHVAETLKNHDVTVHLGTEVEAIFGEDHVAGVRFDDGQIQTDLVLLGIGIRPNTDLIQETEIKCGDSEAIRTDKYGRTNVDDIFAAGDCAEMRHTVTGEMTWVPLGLTANRAGRAIGNTVAGSPTPVGEIAG
ncbi:MAG: FAD/NAD(P)-binding oxidoreductase, partial [Halobacteriaceae archaeon]